MPAEVRGARRLAFKTGTSYGFRDFWAVGYDREVTIGVWAGRRDGTPTPGHSGRITAAPVLLEIADLLGSPRSSGIALPPSGALLVGRDSLPPRLRWLGPDAADASRARGPEILYLPDGALIDWHGEDLPLEAVGGKQPLRWLVDGRPLAPGALQHEVYWQPEETGFVHLSVIDPAGRSAYSTVRLSP